MAIRKYLKYNKAKKRAFYLAIPFIALIALLPEAMAHCPLCTAATVLGVGITRSFGLDDSIVGIFAGALIISSALWANNLIKKLDTLGNSYLRLGSITLATFVLTSLGFYYAGIFGPANTYRIFGIEKILFGTFSGMAVSLSAYFASAQLKKNNRGKTLFNYQTMALTFAGLIINAFIFWVVFR